jgi:hypothetical protein
MKRHSSVPGGARAPGAYQGIWYSYDQAVEAKNANARLTRSSPFRRGQVLSLLRGCPDCAAAKAELGGTLPVQLTPLWRIAWYVRPAWLPPRLP